MMTNEGLKLRAFVSVSKLDIHIFTGVCACTCLHVYRSVCVRELSSCLLFPSREGGSPSCYEYSMTRGE